MTRNDYIPFSSEILEVIKHTEIEYTFRMAYEGNVLPGQFFEVSIPKYGEAPISVSGIAKGSVDLTIRRVGRVTKEVFERYVGDRLLLRGPYGNGFDVSVYKNKELVVVAGGTGVSPVRGLIDYFSEHAQERKSMQIITGFKSEKDILFKEDYKRWRQTMDVTLTLDSGEESALYKIGLVTKYIPGLQIEDIKSAQAVVVGPPAMMRFSVAALLEKGFLEENIWISHERKMCCGLGKCGHCRIGSTYVCLDGPVFNYVQGKNLID
ncbi:MAG TPA: anaerobic sulfite reductase subunit AsrB [Lachnospiraceae bacterium]